MKGADQDKKITDRNMGVKFAVITCFCRHISLSTLFLSRPLLPTTGSADMPINVHADIRRLDQDAFGDIAYEVMNQVFAIHNEMGRFLDEHIYQSAVAARVARDAFTEVLIEVAFDGFRSIGQRVGIGQKGC